MSAITIKKIPGLLLTISMMLMLFSCSVASRHGSSSSRIKKTSGRIKTEPIKVIYRSGRMELSTTTCDEYCLGYGDVLEIKFFNHPEFNEEITIRPDGRISLQRIGDIYAIGLTPTALDSIITGIYADILINPDITIFVRQFGGQRVYVFGEVERPGAYDLDRNLTILRALALAGGPKTGSNLKSVLLMRRHPKNELIGVLVDMTLPMLHKNLRNDLDLQANDVIYVPKSLIKNVNAFLSQFYDVILPPIDYYTRWRYWKK